MRRSRTESMRIKAQLMGACPTGKGTGGVFRSQAPPELDSFLITILTYKDGRRFLALLPQHFSPFSPRAQIIPPPFLHFSQSRCIIDHPIVSLTLPPRRMVIQGMGDTPVRHRPRTMEEEANMEGNTEEDILDTPRNLLPREVHPLVQIRSFGIGSRRWIRIGLGLSP